MQYFRLFGQYHLCNSRVVVISANLSLSRAICEWNEYKLSYVQIRNELASEQLIKVQFQVAMSGRYNLQ